MSRLAVTRRELGDWVFSLDYVSKYQLSLLLNWHLDTSLAWVSIWADGMHLG